MCGITGYVGGEDCHQIIHEGLKNLEYRGYDSAGIAINGPTLSVEKQQGEVSNLDLTTTTNGTCGIGHTRWSTHGEPTDENAHPHTDCTNTIAVVHNGIIENYDDLKTDLLDSHVFESETDTEVVPHLLEEALHTQPSLLAAMQAVTHDLDGSYAIAATHVDEDGIVVARQDSPLIIGHGEDDHYLGSDVTAFADHTRDVTYLEDGDIAHLTQDAVHIYNDGERVSRPVETIEWDSDAVEKAGYDHYMLKEIHGQPRALRQALSGRVDQLSGRVDLDLSLDPETLKDVQKVEVVACGTSYHAGVYAKELLETHTDLDVSVTHASEYAFTTQNPGETLVLAITQSGETADTLSALREATGAGAHSIAITNTLGSTVTREVDDTVFIRAGPEIGVAATKTFVSQVATTVLLTTHLGRVRGTLDHQTTDELLESLRDLPGAIQQVLDEEATFRDLAREHAESEAFFYIGRRYGYPVALESALKLKEISYDHAEGFPAGELKHGPLALVTPDTPVLAILTEGAASERTLNNVKEVDSRGAPTIGLTTNPDHERFLDHAIDLPECGILEPLVANVALQLFAYHVANEKDRAIDKPRNLAKSVTVE